MTNVPNIITVGLFILIVHLTIHMSRYVLPVLIHSHMNKMS